MDNPLTTITMNLEKLGKTFWVAASFFLILIIGWLDFCTGYELSFSLFYLLPISIMTWFIGKYAGLSASLFSAIVWFIADIASGHQYSLGYIFFWNAVIRLGIFLILTLVLSKLRTILQQARVLSRTDFLTGAFNTRYFYELLTQEAERISRYRHPFSLAYLDLDNFKLVNDQYGHTEGDRVLQTIVTEIKKNLRKTDYVARLGGDEFGLLLPETGTEGCRKTIEKIQTTLLIKMQQNNWPVTFSIGVLICDQPTCQVDQIIQTADDLMYSVKRNGKNGVKYMNHTETKGKNE
jgi:diguanylate cyclase (GGDEF)-like protein